MNDTLKQYFYPRRYLVFPGDLLHGVLPGVLIDRESSDRLTLMVNFWCHPIRDPKCYRRPSHPSVSLKERFVHIFYSCDLQAFMVQKLTDMDIRCHEKIY